jgi:hypothetical protein
MSHEAPKTTLCLRRHVMVFVGFSPRNHISRETNKFCVHDAFTNGLSIVHSKLHSITPMATKVHEILRSSVVLTWMLDNRGIR